MSEAQVRIRSETDGAGAGEPTTVVVSSDEMSVRVSVAGHNLQIEAGPEEGGVDPSAD